MNSKHDYSYYENECHIENTDNEYLSFKEKHVESTRFFFESRKINKRKEKDFLKSSTDYSNRKS
jgi:hypothetical protein